MSAPGVGGAGVERGELADELAELAGRLEAAEAYLHLDRLRARHSELEAQLADPGLWEEPERARRLSAEYGRVRSDLEELERLRRSLTEARELHDLALEEGEEALEALRPELREALDGVRAALEELELRSLFAGEYDERDAVCEIHAGAGGTDAQDWAEMLLRMYLRWAERHGFGV
jgi:peptide chain release factor 2